ncbi:MAG TPA: N-acetylmuramoyl-L-alanine amidase, partial [Terriglobales bacterium]
DRGPKIPSVEDVQAILQVHSIDRTPPPSEEPDGASHATILADYGVRKTRTYVIVALLSILLALVAGGIAWWKFHPGAGSASANRQPETATAQPEENSSDSTEGNGNSKAVADASTKPGGAAEVRDVRHWSSAQSSTVVIDLQDQVQYEAHRLSDPERIYFDLHDTNLAAGLAKTFEIGDALLVRVRVAQPRPRVTRVVLETKGAPNFSVSLEPSPYRLVVEVRSVGNAGKPRAKVDLFAPVNPESVQALAVVDESPRQNSRHTRSALSTLRIALDAGHGGWDLGTVGRSGLVEKDLVLDVVARLGAMLEQRLGAEVIYTRQDDNYIALEKRAEIANLAHADVFLSVHANYSSYAYARGVETYYTNTYSSVNARSPETDAKPLRVNWTDVDIRQKVRQSKRLALNVQGALYRGLAEQSSVIRDRGVKEATYVVLTGTIMPAILAEVSFVSSPEDEQSLRDPQYRQQIAEAIFKGVESYGSEVRKVNVASTSAKTAGSF